MIIFESPQELFGAIGTKIGPSRWVEVDQDRINGFAEVTGDHQWIHVDEARAKEGPFGATIAHGFLTMSMVNMVVPEIMEVRGFTHAVNIGVDRLRFLSPVRVGSRVRAVAEIMSAEEKPGSVQLIVRVTMEIEGGEKPACVLDTVSRYYYDAK